MSARLTIVGSLVERFAAGMSTPRRQQIAREIAAEARGNAAVLTGAYRDGIGTEFRRTVVRVVDEDEDAIYKEYGTSKAPAHAALTDAARRRGRYRGWRPR
ncbi:hypothetical protein [Micromonospora sp. NPDC048169]|uniref:hypothetical protein n=1 Tax=Micromonospora sp. NPDC048169 TaxID=3154711 RepID=UPI0033ECAC96